MSNVGLFLVSWLFFSSYLFAGTSRNAEFIAEENSKLLLIQSFFSTNKEFFACTYGQDDYASSFVQGEKYTFIKSTQIDNIIKIEISGVFAFADTESLFPEVASHQNTTLEIDLITSKFFERKYQTKTGFIDTGSYYTLPKVKIHLGEKKVNIKGASKNALIGIVGEVLFELVADLNDCKVEI